MSVSVSITFDRFPQIAAKLPVETKAVVVKTAYDVEGRAKGLITSQNAIDTGRLLNSVEAKPIGEFVWEIAPHTEYAIYVEMGTYKMGARPYMIPAGEAAKGPFVQAMTQLLQRL